MTSIQKSMRIPKEIVAEIQGIAERSGKDFSTITKELLQEAIRMHRCPGIVFAEGVTGRRARIAGTGLAVWEVIATHKSVGEDFDRLRSAYHWLNDLQLRSALGYYRAYPKEIDALIDQNKGWTKESIHRTYPFLAGTSEAFR